MNAQFCTQCGTRLESDDRFCTSCGSAVPRIEPLQRSQERRPKATVSQPVKFRIIGALFLAAVAVFLLYQANSPQAVNIADEHDEAGLPYPTITRISVTEAKERMENGSAIVVDVRGAEEYAESHIANALSLPLNDLQSRYRELAPNSEIITYCT